MCIQSVFWPSCCSVFSSQTEPPKAQNNYVQDLAKRKFRTLKRSMSDSIYALFRYNKHRLNRISLLLVRPPKPTEILLKIQLKKEPFRTLKRSMSDSMCFLASSKLFLSNALMSEDASHNRICSRDLNSNQGFGVSNGSVGFRGV
jgi:hypothetical protein